MSELEVTTPARQRLVQDLLGWGQARPLSDEASVAEIRAELDAGLSEFGEALDRAAATTKGGQLLITKTRLDRVVCDGLQLDPKPFEYSRASARGVLCHATVEQDLRGGRERHAADLVQEVWHSEATRRPGDPNSLSAWMNQQPREAAQELCEELIDLLEGFREVWPRLPAQRVVLETEKPIGVSLSKGRVKLFGRPDIVLSSPAQDGYSRSLVVDLKTGRPRSEHDRHELRFYALLVTLSAGRSPFRWGTLYVTEGRHESEDLRHDVLLATVRRVVDTARQLIGLSAFTRDAPEKDLQLRAGVWCLNCARESSCTVAAAFFAQREADEVG